MIATLTSDNLALWKITQIFPCLNKTIFLIKLVNNFLYFISFISLKKDYAVLFIHTNIVMENPSNFSCAKKEH